VTEHYPHKSTDFQRQQKEPEVGPSEDDANRRQDGASHPGLARHGRNIMTKNLPLGLVSTESNLDTLLVPKERACITRVRLLRVREACAQAKPSIKVTKQYQYCRSSKRILTDQGDRGRMPLAAPWERGIHNNSGNASHATHCMVSRHQGAWKVNEMPKRQPGSFESVETTSSVLPPSCASNVCVNRF
jgi:hypothetical protein